MSLLAKLINLTHPMDLHHFSDVSQPAPGCHMLGGGRYVASHGPRRRHYYRASSRGPVMSL